KFHNCPSSRRGVAPIPFSHVDRLQRSQQRTCNHLRDLQLCVPLENSERSELTGIILLAGSSFPFIRCLLLCSHFSSSYVRSSVHELKCRYWYRLRTKRATLFCP